MAALADVAFVSTDEGGLVIGVLISTPGGISVASGDEINDLRLDFWVDLAEL